MRRREWPEGEESKFGYQKPASFSQSSSSVFEVFIVYVDRQEKNKGNIYEIIFNLKTIAMDGVTIQTGGDDDDKRL